MTELFGTPAPTFDDPLEMLSACHGRIKDQCATLLKLAAYLPQHGADEQVRQAAARIMRYFDVAGRHHHDDEEQDLFPALRATGNAEALSLVERLLVEHAEMGQAWTPLRRKLAILADGGKADITLDEAQHFVRLYDLHIAHEEQTLLPLAARLLDRERLQSIGTIMARRRVKTVTP